MRVKATGAAGRRARFLPVKPHANADLAALREGHPALTEARSRYPGSVVSAEDAPRLLVSGHNNAKIGVRVEKGAWAGMPIFMLTLEERATCPRSCALWSRCYGNGMPFARRHRHGPALVLRLERELRALAVRHPGGFVVRLRILGDFYSRGYGAWWAHWVREMPELRVFGYTAHPRASAIGGILARANARWPDRFAVRFSVAEPTGASMEATVIWRQPEAAIVPEGQVCPASAGLTAGCGTCGLCWNPAIADQTIAFIGHGQKPSGRKRKDDDAREIA